MDWQAKPQWRLPGVDCGTLTVDKCQRRGNLEAPQRQDRRSHLDGRAPFMMETAAMSRHLSKRSSLLRDDEHVAGWSESGEGAMRQDVCSSVVGFVGDAVVALRGHGSSGSTAVIAAAGLR